MIKRGSIENLSFLKPQLLRHTDAMKPKLSVRFLFVATSTLLLTKFNIQAYSLSIRPHMQRNQFLRLHPLESPLMGHVIYPGWNHLHGVAGSSNLCNLILMVPFRTSMTLAATPNDGRISNDENNTTVDSSFNVEDNSRPASSVAKIGNITYLNPLSANIVDKDIEKELLQLNNKDQEESNDSIDTKTKMQSKPNELYLSSEKESSSPSREHSTPLLLTDFHMTIREDKKDQIRHMEFYLKKKKGGLWWAAFIQFLPYKFRPKPCAKTGVRTYVSSSIMMDNIIEKCFSSDFIAKRREIIKNKRKNEISKLSDIKNKFYNFIMKLINQIANTINIILGKGKDEKFINNTNNTTNNNNDDNDNNDNNDNNNYNNHNKNNRNIRNVKIINPLTSGSAESKWIAKNIKNNNNNENHVKNENRNEINNKNNNDNNKNIKNNLIGLFVYAWIKPSLRGMFFGDILLECGSDMCRHIGADYMILVHDDNGSGRLISYYEKKDFIPVFDTIEKGMIGII